MTLALHGGKPVRTLPMPPRPAYSLEDPYGLKERNAVNNVLTSGNLSGFLAQEGPEFYGGEKVQDLEKAWCEKFGVRYAVSMNSATSCLFAAVQAVTKPGDEVIVAPWSMSASAVCVLEANCIPVFADIDPETYCIDPQSVADKITERTQAIVTVDLFGLSAHPKVLHAGLTIIEDAAQSIGATCDGEWAGTIGDIGVFSLNRHKTLQCGEGGVAVTNNAEIAFSLQRYRNHGENCGGTHWGGNYRLSEIHAALAEVQLERLEELTEPRIRNAQRLTEALSELDGIYPPQVPKGLRHVYYLYAVRIKETIPGMFHVALKAEGIPIGRYVKPLYRLPVFGYQNGSLPGIQKMRDSHPGVEQAYREVFVLPHVHAGMKDEDIDDVIEAFKKVWTHREEI